MARYDFDFERHEQTATALLAAHARLRDDVIPQVAATTRALTSNPLLWPWRGAIVNASIEAQEQLGALDRTVATLLVPVVLPRRLWHAADGWTLIREQVSGVAGDLQVTNREVHIRWRGAARDAYDAVIPAHRDAATALASVADTLDTALSWMGLITAMFYAALLGILLNVIAGIIVALVTAATVAGGVAGIVLIGMITAAALSEVAVLTLATREAVGRLKIFLNEITGAMRDRGGFPNGQWPQARTEWYSDATVTDGDADWSVVP